MTREEAIKELKYNKEDDTFVISEEVLDMAIKALEQEPKTRQFAKWVAREIFDDEWEYNKDAFTEIACRKLAKFGIVIRTGDEWELVEQEPCDTCEHSDEIDGSNCYECVKGIRDRYSPQPCEDAISRQAVEDKLLKLCNELEGIFANIRMKNQDESVCGLCEYDCPAPYECPGFDIEDCFKLADEIRHEWQSTKDLPPVNPQYTEDEIQKMQDIEQAEIEKAYELGKAEGQEK